MGTFENGRFPFDKIFENFGWEFKLDRIFSGKDFQKFRTTLMVMVQRNINELAMRYVEWLTVASNDIALREIAQYDVE